MHLRSILTEEAGIIEVYFNILIISNVCIHSRFASLPFGAMLSLVEVEDLDGLKQIQYIPAGFNGFKI